MKTVKLAAHRGFSEFYPENTLIAFREALKLDIDMVETDLHMTADGEIILMHDHTVDRTTNGTGLIKEKTLAEMLALDAGSWKGQQFEGTKVPTFREFLELMKDYPEIEMNIELKDYPEMSGDFALESCDKSLAMLEEYGMADRIYINAWSGELLQYISEKYNGRYRLHGYYPMFLNRGNFDKDSYLSRMFCVCLFNRYQDETGKIVKYPDVVMPQADFSFVESQGVEPWVFFNPDTEDALTRAVRQGAVGVTTNEPVFAGKVLDKIGARKLK